MQTKDGEGVATPINEMKKSRGEVLGDPDVRTARDLLFCLLTRTFGFSRADAIRVMNGKNINAWQIHKRQRTLAPIVKKYGELGLLSLISQRARDAG
jgi:hypothetical protein